MKHQSKINHLHWRSGFGLASSEFGFYDQSIEKNVETIFAKAKTIHEIEAHENSFITMAILSKKERRKKSVESVQKIKNDWLIRMTKPEYSALLERMCLFWHGHFACRIVLGGKIASSYLKAIRKNALGSFKSMVLDITRDPAMIRYLNNQQNKKGQPNENFARELMELFTLGRGHYTENDIKESARAFTGWSSNLKGEFVFRKWQHDYGSKEFMGHKGNFNGEDIIDIILAKRETARFITEKIYRYFVNETIDAKIIDQLSRRFFNSGYDIAALMREIFSSHWFYDPKNQGNKIKSPVEFIAGMMRLMEIEIGNPLALIAIQNQLGQVLLNPPNVAGWPGGRSWIDNASLLTRLNLAFFVFGSSGLIKGDFAVLKRRFSQLKINANCDNLYALIGDENKSEVVSKLSEILINGDSPDLYKIQYGLRLKRKEDYFNNVLARIMSTPEYQMC